MASVYGVEAFNKQNISKLSSIQRLALARRIHTKEMSRNTIIKLKNDIHDYGTNQGALMAELEKTQ